MERIHSLYLHVPFCTWVCKYCDFNAYAVLEGLIPPYIDALSREIELAGVDLAIGPLDTVFIGGGTPSLLTTAQLRQVLVRVKSIGLVPGAEITLEANPSNVTSEQVDGWLAAGINRLSIGVQSLQPDALRFLERLHSGADAITAIRTARAGGFRNVSADLLYGVPGVHLKAWLETLEAVLGEVQHLSTYELTVESGTRLGQEVRTGLVQMPDADEQLEQYWAAAARLEAAGYVHYEISNWSRPGFACRHNLAAWNYQPYLGCGAGAHSMFRGHDDSTERRWNVKGPHAYIRRIADIGRAVDGHERLSPHRARGEAAMIGVRLLDGTTATRDFPVQRRQLVGSGLLVEDHGQVRLTRRGVELANQVGATFLV